MWSKLGWVALHMMAMAVCLLFLRAPLFSIVLFSFGDLALFISSVYENVLYETQKALFYVLFCLSYCDEAGLFVVHDATYIMLGLLAHGVGAH